MSERTWTWSRATGTYSGSRKSCLQGEQRGFLLDSGGGKIRNKHPGGALPCREMRVAQLCSIHSEVRGREREKYRGITSYV